MGTADMYQTYNHVVFGPTFGGRFDLYFGYYDGLPGYAKVYSYGPEQLTGASIAGGNPTIGQQYD